MKYPNLFKAFNKYREGTPYEPKQPSYEKLLELIEEMEDNNII